MELMEYEIDENKAIFCAYLKECINSKKDVEKLIKYLEENGFFEAPCSAGHHLAIDGGLCEHSLSVMYLALHLRDTYGLPIKENSIIKCALLHDIIKIFFYEKIDGKWQYRKKTTSHGEGSITILKSFIKLTKQEKEMIRWHMGPYTEYYDGHQPGDFLKWSADKKNPNIKAALFLYFCDHLSAMFLEE